MFGVFTWHPSAGVFMLESDKLLSGSGFELVLVLLMSSKSCSNETIKTCSASSASAPRWSENIR